MPSLQWVAATLNDGLTNEVSVYPNMVTACAAYLGGVGDTLDAMCDAEGEALVSALQANSAAVQAVSEVLLGKHPQGLLVAPTAEAEGFVLAPAGSALHMQALALA